jgi:alpha-amylase
MVDVVVNDVMSTSTTPDLSPYMFTEPVCATKATCSSFSLPRQEQYHPFCWVNYSSTVSEEECWLGDSNVPLPDLNTENATVVAGFQSWITNMVKTYNIDGLRIDGEPFINFIVKKNQYDVV